MILDLSIGGLINGNVIEETVTLESEFDYISENIKVLPILERLNVLDLENYMQIELEEYCIIGSTELCRRKSYMFKSGDIVYQLKSTKSLSQAKRIKDLGSIEEIMPSHSKDCSHIAIFKTYYLTICINKGKLMMVSINMQTYEEEFHQFSYSINSIDSFTVEKLSDSKFFFRETEGGMILNMGIILVSSQKKKLGVKMFLMEKVDIHRGSMMAMKNGQVFLLMIQSKFTVSEIFMEFLPDLSEYESESVLLNTLREKGEFGYTRHQHNEMFINNDFLIQGRFFK